MTVFEGNRPLLDAFRRGDRAALTTVYGHYVKSVATLVRLGFRLTTSRVSIPGISDEARARDVIQEVFVRAFSERARLAYDGLSLFRPWLLRIAKNLMIDEGRRAGRMTVEASAEPNGDDPHEVLPVSAEEELLQHRLREATREYCATLDAEAKRFVQLRFEEERSQAEVAELMNTTRRRVRTLEDMVRAGLRKHLASRGYP